ncbi:hypothetical protein DM02DRAFT_611662 [Periconia macrospinosa]|uniref:Glutathione S-transferase UstS-like C-terminal domain-containing protein n=1 Tax=Periconia macrospinosa TaxID=97972 RepID=A0A2V1E0Z5_9PLEO|nr:hypothetical protein DM02DRAFT_611662 [Periconia macrospinosa]
MILNYKGIDYKTEWVEYPDLVSKFKGFGLPPNDKNAPGYFTDYSSPAVKYEDGTYDMDSWLIAQSLERRYPEPSLHLDDPITVKIRDAISSLMDPLVPHVIPKVVYLLNKPSADYFNETREKSFGAPLSAVEQSANEEHWEKAKAPAKEVGDLLREHEGPFFLGDKVSYADFIFVSFLHFLKRVDKDNTLFERYLALDPTFPKIYNASKQWLENEA